MKAQHEMQEPRLEQLWSNPRRASIWFKFLVQARVDYRHGLRLVCHPEIVDVFQTALATQPTLVRVSLEEFLTSRSAK